MNPEVVFARLLCDFARSAGLFSVIIFSIIIRRIVMISIVWDSKSLRSWKPDIQVMNLVKEDDKMFTSLIVKQIIKFEVDK